ncbi:MAG: TPR end-of-group domain-containing protein [Fluviicola sp.]
MKIVLYSLAFSTLFASCGNPAIPDSEVGPDGKTAVDETNPVSLNAADLFNGEKVRLFLYQNPKANPESNKLFLSALDEFKNKKNLVAAKEGFKASIAAYPSSKSYYELGNVCMEMKNYQGALEAYSLAEKLGYEPFSKVMFNVACAYSQLKNFPMSADYLQFAIQAGYVNMDNIEKDPDLANLRDQEPDMFRKNMDLALSGVSDIENLYFLQFKRQFLPASFPINLNMEQEKVVYDDKNRISYDYERYVSEMRNERFSRDVSKEFYNFVQVAEKANFVALIYVVKESFNGDQSPLTYRLVTFTKTGKLIDKKEIAGRQDYSELLKMCTISKDLTFTITNYETTFEKNPDEEGYYDNPVVSKKKINLEKYRIDASGKILYQDGKTFAEPTAMLNGWLINVL